jgi:hypothetical protein
MPASWEQYYLLRGLPSGSPVARLLSGPLTVVFALLNCRTIPNVHACTDLVVHLIGAEKECYQLHLFSEVWHLLRLAVPELRTLRIDLVGPSIPTHLNGQGRLMHQGLSFHFHKHVYDGWLQEPGSRLPDAVIALNAGFDAFEAWHPTMKLIVALNLPLVFTDHTRVSCHSACMTFGELGGTVSLSPQVNPFVAPFTMGKPATYMPNYLNGYISTINCGKK